MVTKVNKMSHFIWHENISGVIIKIANEGGFMKKFFKKLPVLITFAVVTVLMVALTIGMSVRPISHGMTYSGTKELLGKEINFSYKFKNSREVVVKTEETEVTMYYLNNGHKFALLPQVSSAEAYDKFVDDIKGNKDTWNKLWEGESVFNINAFKITAGKGDSAVTATAGGAIALVTILAIVDLALVGCTALAVAYRVKKK